MNRAGMRSFFREFLKYSPFPDTLSLNDFPRFNLEINQVRSHSIISEKPDFEWQNQIV